MRNDAEGVMALASLIAEAMSKKGITREQLVDMTGYSLSAVGDILIGKILRPSTVNRNRLAEALDLDPALILDASRRASAAAGLQRMPRTQEDVIRRRPGAIPPAARSVPVMGQAAGGVDGEYYFNGTIVDYVPCPPGMENVTDAYAVYVDGDSMWPRLGSRDTVWAHPGKSARPGDDVVVQIGKNGVPQRGYVKRFVGWTEKKLRLQQFNPAKELTFDRKDVISIHPIDFIKPA